MNDIPSYDYEDFKDACRNKNYVFISKKVLEDANKIFKLKTRFEIMNFISNDGLEKLSFINTKSWENNPNTDEEIFVDAYDFSSLDKKGYIAFFYNKRTNMWNIKSLHLSNERNNIMEIALKKANLLTDDKGGTYE